MRIVLDTGSQQSYITNSVKEKLSLVPEGEQCMLIMTFGSNEEKPQVCEFVKVGLTLRDGETQQLTLLAIPHFAIQYGACFYHRGCSAHLSRSSVSFWKNELCTI